MRRPKTGGRKPKKGPVADFAIFRERNTSFSLFARDPTVGSLRSKKESSLHDETYAWASDLRSFDKLREVGVSPYLGFILYLSTLLMFELNEVVRGRLIGSKSWNRGVGFLKPMWTVRDCPRAELGC